VAEFTLPELGENIESGDVVRVLVKQGDTVQPEQTVLELETDKATIEVPSSVGGVVKDVKVKSGDKVKVGQTILVVDESGAAAAPKEKAEAAPAAKEQKAAGAPKAESKPPSEAAVEGGLDTDAKVQPESAAAAGARGREDREQGSGETESPAPAASQPQGRPSRVVDISAGRAPVPATSPSAPVPAAPSTRRYARELGLDVAEVPGSGPGGRISADDVKSQARAVITGSAGRAGGRVQLPDFTKWGEVDRQPMRAIRRKTAERMAAAWNTVPHVTQGDKADITALEDLRKKYARRVEQAGGKLTITAIALKVVASALKVFPQFNAAIDVAADEIVYKKYTHIGVAVDTENGLLVPVIRDVDRKNIQQLSVELQQVAERAKARKLSLDEMEGGSFTISNLGGIGGTYFTPIINAPEVAILGMSRSTIEPVWIDDDFEPRLMMPLSLSYDHRLIDGADAIRFLRWVCEAFEQPLLMSLQG